VSLVPSMINITSGLIKTSEGCSATASISIQWP
jgi:hypothetical protein